MKDKFVKFIDKIIDKLRRSSQEAMLLLISTILAGVGTFLLKLYIENRVFPKLKDYKEIIANENNFNISTSTIIIFNIVLLISIVVIALSLVLKIKGRFIYLNLGMGILNLIFYTVVVALKVIPDAILLLWFVNLICLLYPILKVLKSIFKMPITFKSGKDKKDKAIFRNIGLSEIYKGNIRKLPDDVLKIEYFNQKSIIKNVEITIQPVLLTIVAGLIYGIPSVYDWIPYPELIATIKETVGKKISVFVIMIVILVTILLFNYFNRMRKRFLFIDDEVRKRGLLNYDKMNYESR